jgi:hypothetical protein
MNGNSFPKILNMALSTAETQIENVSIKNPITAGSSLRPSHDSRYWKQTRSEESRKLSLDGAGSPFKGP